MYGVDMSKKENRLKVRKIYLSEGAMVIELPELQFQAFITDDPPTITAFSGTAGKPYMYYRYRSVESRDKTLQEAIDAQKKNLEYKAQRKQENKGTLTGSAATAKAIKTRLTKEFPGIKFSVTSDNYSMGNSVSIRWTDGPMYDTVNAITQQYCYGRFDGMTDCSYSVAIDTEGLGCPGSKHVSCSRSLSEEYRAQVQAVLERDFTPYHEYNGTFAPFQWEEAEKKLLGITQEEEPGEVQETEETVEAQQTTKAQRNNYALDCGCTVHYKAEVHKCAHCGKTLCGQHTYFYVDESNIAITNNSPGLCFECYKAKYEPTKPADNDPYKQPDIQDGFLYECHFKAWHYEIDVLKGALDRKSISYDEGDGKLFFYLLTSEEARRVKELSDLNVSILFIDNIRPAPAGSEELSKPDNVIDFSNRLKAKQAQQEGEKAISRFKTDYLPFLSKDDMQALTTCPEADRGAEIVRICMRIDLEQGRGF